MRDGSGGIPDQVGDDDKKFIDILETKRKSAVKHARKILCHIKNVKKT